jgi:hypothetical protein
MKNIVIKKTTYKIKHIGRTKRAYKTSHTGTNSIGGFAALVLVVLVSAALMAAVLGNATSVSNIFDEANHKQYRLTATNAALACLDRTILELTHDYFFTISVTTAGVSYPILHCSIVSVGESGLIASVIVSGNSNNVTATVTAQVLLSDRNISVLSETTSF